MLARFATEQAAYEATVTAREAQEKETGKKPRGKPPLPPSAGPRATDQVNLTDPESRVMPVAGGGFEQCYNTQAAVDTDLPSPPHWPRRQPPCSG